jgi:hypothetical protein
MPQEMAETVNARGPRIGRECRGMPTNRQTEMSDGVTRAVEGRPEQPRFWLNAAFVSTSLRAKVQAAKQVV